MDLQGTIEYCASWSFGAWGVADLRSHPADSPAVKTMALMIRCLMLYVLLLHIVVLKSFCNDGSSPSSSLRSAAYFWIGMVGDFEKCTPEIQRAFNPPDGTSREGTCSVGSGLCNHVWDLHVAECHNREYSVTQPLPGLLETSLVLFARFVRERRDCG